MAKPDLIPESSAQEERDEERNWRSVVIMGLERKIDLKVIEPYKKVISRIFPYGYLALLGLIPSFLRFFFLSRYFHMAVTKATIVRRPSSYSALVFYPIEAVSITTTSWNIFFCEI